MHNSELYSQGAQRINPVNLTNQPHIVHDNCIFNTRRADIGMQYCTESISTYQQTHKCINPSE